MNYTFSKKILLRTPLIPFQESFKIKNKEQLEALFLASPSLYDEFQRTATISAEEKKKLLNSLMKYATRMQSRCTPFGLFAGCSVGNWEEETNIQIEQAQNHQRHTRLDMNYLCALGQNLSEKDFIKNNLLFFPNTSIYSLHDKIRYVEYKYQNAKRFHQISAIDDSEYIQNVLKRAENGANILQLAEVLVDEEITLEEASEFVGEIIEAQLLVSELEPSITGDEFILQILRVLHKIQTQNPNKLLSEIIMILELTQKDIQTIDTKLGNDPKVYRDIAERLKTLEVSFEMKLLFQTDLVTSTQELSLKKTHQIALSQTLELLNTIVQKPNKTNLSNFREAFYSRYEDKEMPLLEVMDKETGIAYLTNQKGTGDYTPLVSDISLPSRSGGTREIKWSAWESYLHKQVIESIKSDSKVVKLDAKEIDKIFPNKKTIKESTDLPDTMAMMFSHLGGAENEEKILLKSIGGSTAANLLGRFAHADKEVHNMVDKVRKVEETLNPNVIFAEIVHLPESRIGNILLRPTIGKYEIPYLAKPSVNQEHTISLDDLYVSVNQSKVFLRSKKLNKEVIPRLTSAHNFSANALPIYQFLCEMQTQSLRSGLYFSWGEVGNMFDFLPRVEYKNIILSYATWTLKKSNYEALAKTKSEDLLKKTKEFREKHQIPQYIALVDGDNELFVDLESQASCEMFFSTIKKRGNITIREYLFDSQTAIVRDTDNKAYTNEFIALLYKDKKEQQVLRPKREKTQNTQRDFSLGSEWLYYKLYCGNKTADKILCEAIKPLTEKLLQEKIIDKWFFIRYSDPETHIRLRFHFTDLAQKASVISEMARFCAEFENSGLLWKVQTDTYQRELERYGSNSIEISENLFCYDSIAIVNMLAMLEGDSGENIRWKFAIRAVDELLSCFGYTMEAKRDLLERLKTGFGNEFGMNRGLKGQIDKKFRNERKNIENVLDFSQDEESELLPLFNILKWKNERLTPIAKHILDLEKANQLEMSLNDLMGSYIHMLLNRLFKSKQRLHEMVVYDFMYRHYCSNIARNKKKKEKSVS